MSGARLQKQVEIRELVKEGLCSSTRGLLSPAPRQGRRASKGNSPAGCGLCSRPPASRYPVQATRSDPHEEQRRPLMCSRRKWGFQGPRSSQPERGLSVSQTPRPLFGELGLSSWARFDALPTGLRRRAGAAEWFWAKFWGSQLPPASTEQRKLWARLYLAFARMQLGSSLPPPLGTAPAPCCQASLSTYTARLSSPLRYKPPFVLLALPVLPTFEQIPI